MPKVISRVKAKEQGLIKFYTGIPCRYGHTSERYVNEGKCVKCLADRNKIRGKKYYLENKERLKPIRKRWWEKNREKAVEYQREYRKKNPENYKKTIDKGRDNLRVYQAEYYQVHKKRILNTKYNRLKIDKIFRLRELVSSRITRGLKDLVNGRKKSMKTVMYLGCTFGEYKIYLEKKFKNKMNWSNMGGKTGWQIDHIRPLASFDLSKESEQLKAFNYKNTQPMWAYDNRSKGSKIIR